jgi:hypothetical protein
MPFTVQVTELFAAPVTLALRLTVPFVCTLAREGDTVTVTVTGDAEITTSALAPFDGSWLLTAVIVTVLGFGTTGGAV